MIRLLDVSANQPRINWPVVAAAGYSAAMVKASEGVNYEDPRCRDHCDGVRKNGLELGTYHYLRVRHGVPQDARKQVRQYLEIWKREGCNLKPCLDVERGQNEGATAAEFAEAVTTAIDEVEKQVSESPLIYTSRGEWMAYHLDALTSLSRCPLWLASYTLTATPPGPWTSYVAWQFTGSGTILAALVDHDGPLDLSTAADLAPMRMPV